MRSLFAAAAAVVLLAPAGALAQPVSDVSGPDTYLELHAGAVFPQHDDVDALDTGWSIGGTFGARFTRNLGVEGEIAYQRSSVESSAAIEETLSIVPITASVRLTLPFQSIELSALGGVGLHVATYDVDVDPPGSGASDTATAFGFHVGAGIGFNLSPTMLVGVDVRRTFVEAKFDGIESRLDTLRLAVKLGYRF